MNTRRQPPHNHHSYPAVAIDTTHYGLPNASTGRADGQAIADLISACLDACAPCQEKALDRVSYDVASCARLVEMFATADMWKLTGGVRLPVRDQYDTGGSRYLTAAAKAALTPTGFDHQACYDAIDAMQPIDRMRMCDLACDYITGILQTDITHVTEPAMIYLKTSGPVRRAIGEENTAALTAGIGLPADAQCWKCGDTINLLASPEPISLGCVQVGLVSVTTFAHFRCSPPLVLTPEEFEAQSSKKPSDVQTSDEVIIEPDGSIILDNMIVNGEHPRLIPKPTKEDRPPER